MVLTMTMLGASSVAHADRSAILSVGGMFGATGDFEGGYTEPAWGGRLSLGFDNPLPEMPATRGYKWDGAIVPELVIGGLVLPDAERADGYFGAGIRAELRFAQRDMGLLRVSARGAGYIALRGLVVGEERDGLFEFGIGEYFARHRSSTRIGYEIDVLMAPGDRPMDEGRTDNTVGLLMQLYVGGAL
jgi:hypothetical protein